MVEDSERLRYPDLNVWGWDSRHSDVTETSYISHLRAEFARHKHKDRGVAARSAVCEVSPIPEDLIPASGTTGNAAYATAESGVALTGFVVHRRGLMGENPRRRNDLRRGRPDYAECTGRARRLSCDDVGVGDSARPPTLRRPVAGRRASRPR
jgi:hypothetical protein